MSIFVHPTAIVEKGVKIGSGTRVWDNAHIRHDTQIGEDCIIGEKTYIAYSVKIGNRVKINAMVYICTAVIIEDGVMISAGTIFTNDRYPRAATPDLKNLRPSEPDENTLPTKIREGATIGAGCIIGCNLEVGRFAMVGMGSVVTRPIADFHIAIGQPAETIGYVCRCGEPIYRFPKDIPTNPREVKCNFCGLQYSVKNNTVKELKSHESKRNLYLKIQ